MGIVEAEEHSQALRFVRLSFELRVAHFQTVIFRLEFLIFLVRVAQRDIPIPRRPHFSYAPGPVRANGVTAPTAQTRMRRMCL